MNNLKLKVYSVINISVDYLLCRFQILCVKIVLLFFIDRECRVKTKSRVS